MPFAELEADIGETTNLEDEHPDVATELTNAAQVWRATIEERTRNDWVPAANGTAAHPPHQPSSCPPDPIPEGRE